MNKKPGDYPKEVQILDLKEELKELKEDKEIIYNKIADLYDYIENRNYGEYVCADFILEQLADIQQYAK